MGVASVDVGPPQTQIQGSCSAGSTPPSPPIESAPSGGQVMITFIGAANAQFSQVFGLDGSNMAISTYLTLNNLVFIG